MNIFKNMQVIGLDRTGHMSFDQTGRNTQICRTGPAEMNWILTYIFFIIIISIFHFQKVEKSSIWEGKLLVSRQSSDFEILPDFRTRRVKSSQVKTLP